MQKKINKALILFGALLGTLMIACGIYVLIHDREQVMKGYERQETEEKIAQNFINACINADEALYEATLILPAEEKSTLVKTVTYLDMSGREVVKLLPDTPTFDLTDWKNYGDDNYHLLTPEYALGEFKFVLSIPDINLCRGVYGGDTQEVIEADLANWMVVLMDCRQRLGETNISIAGHDSLNDDLSFNRLIDIESFNYIGEGHDIFIYANEGVYIYQIEDFFDAYRKDGRAAYGYNASLDVSDLYIFTCGRDIAQNPSQIKNHRYKDIIVHGKLKSVLTWREYRAYLEGE